MSQRANDPHPLVAFVAAAGDGGTEESYKAICLACAMAVWLWDRGHQADFEAVVSAALREHWICPTAFLVIHDDIRAGRRVRPARRQAKHKVPALQMFEAMHKLAFAKIDEQAQLQQPRPIRLRPDPEPDQARSASWERVRLLEQSLASSVGISVPTLRRAEREFRQLLGKHLKK